MREEKMKKISKSLLCLSFFLGIILNVSWPAHVRAALLDRWGRLYEHFGDDGVIVDGERNRCDSERGR